MKKLTSVMAIAAFCAFGGACAEEQQKNAEPNAAEQTAANQIDGVTGASTAKEGPCKGKEHCPPPPHGGPHGMPPMGHQPGMMPPPPMGQMPGMMPPAPMGQQPMLMGPVMYRANGYVIIIVPDQGYQQMPMGPMPGMMPPPGAQPGMMPPPPHGAQPGMMPPPPHGAQPGMMPPPPHGAQPGMMPPPPPGKHHGPKPCFKYNPDTGEKNPDCKDGDRKHDGKGPHGPKPDGKK